MSKDLNRRFVEQIDLSRAIKSYFYEEKCFRGLSCSKSEIKTSSENYIIKISKPSSVGLKKREEFNVENIYKKIKTTIKNNSKK